MTSRDPMRVLAFGTLSIALAALPLPALALDAATRAAHVATPLPVAASDAPGQAALMAPPRGRPSHGGGNRPNHNRPSHNRPSHGHRPPARGSSHVTINHYENNSHHGGCGGIDRAQRSAQLQHGDRERHQLLAMREHLVPAPIRGFFGAVRRGQSAALIR